MNANTDLNTTSENSTSAAVIEIIAKIFSNVLF